MPNFRLPFSICRIPSWRVFQNQPPWWLSSDSDSGKTGGGVSCWLGKFSAGKVEKSVWVLTVVESILLQSCGRSRPAASRRILFKRPWCLLDFCPCPRKSPLSQDGSSLLGTCVHVKSLYWSEGYTFQRQGAEVDACALHSRAVIGIRLKEANSEASRCQDINFYRKKHRCFKLTATLT